ncbi:aromatic ring-hydroxylating oxygenase subunit alpha [Paenibacillus zanthoxyli]|uniref:aromatic ring-hydroxylating oxygenase subunit alpha n=1 Tax=Paenibacillus zanthoxyli TaxID=369399 RepID=UPI000472C15C|nr:Rieske 2Fe-2S domain-containing protein [Paenibacillus zanthoxyli]
MSQSIDYNTLVYEERVHSRCYIDPDIFNEEMEKIFHQGWVYVGHASEVPENGDYKTTTIGLQPVIMSRGQDGKIRVLMNRCKHRGPTVCQFQKGNAKFFRCAYHGWTYKNSGELIGVPFPKGYGDDFNKVEYGLDEAAVTGEYRGLIFASLSENAMPFEEYLPEPVRKYIDNFFNLSPLGEIDVRRGVLKTDVNANWKHQLENGSADGYHPHFTHENWMNLIAERLGSARKMGVWEDGGPDSGERQRYLGGPAHCTIDYLEKRKRRAEREGLKIPTQLEQSILAVMPHPDTKGDGSKAWEVYPEMSDEAIERYIADMVQAHGEERAKELLASGGSHMSIFPNLQITPLSIRVLRPVAVNKTDVEVYIPWFKGVPDEFNIHRMRGGEGFFGLSAWGGQEDYEMFERIQEGMEAQKNPWTLLTRGMNRQGIDSDGLMEAGITDELCIRKIWEYWLKVMSGEKEVQDCGKISSEEVARS